jgi:hypothetical protein
MTEELEQKAEEMIVNFFCGVRQEDYTHKETVRLMVKFATEATKELQEQIEYLEAENRSLKNEIIQKCYPKQMEIIKGVSN